MAAYKIAARIEKDGGLHLSSLPFRAGDEVEVIVLRRDLESPKGDSSDPLREQLPPVTRRLLGIAQGVSEEDYYLHLEEKYR
ncbi:MAG TPA: hypothetical protein VF173_20470 [Thermoanaerobaculia bacterium]|nr:hypothetical protein [Thermoanaerobaculia bacterium]